jgi:hypothetical protein
VARDLRGQKGVFTEHLYEWSRTGMNSPRFSENTSNSLAAHGHAFVHTIHRDDDAVALDGRPLHLLPTVFIELAIWQGRQTGEVLSALN